MNRVRGHAEGEVNLSQVDRQFVDSLGVSYAKVAEFLGLSRQAISRGVGKDAEDYFTPVDLAKIVTRFAADDPIRAKLAKKSLSELYPETAREISALLESNMGRHFDPDVPGDFTLVAPDFAVFLGRNQACREELDAIVRAMRDQVGTLLIVHRPLESERRRVWSYIENSPDFDRKASRLSPAECEIDLSPYPTTLLRVGMKNEVDIFYPSEGGFVPIPESETIRIKSNMERLTLSDLDFYKK